MAYIGNSVVGVEHPSTSALNATTGAFTGNVTTTGTVEPAGDTAAGDDAAIGYTSAEGLILTGQGSTSDITLKNDADATVFTVPTGTDDILFPDSAEIQMGAGADLKVSSDGTNGVLRANNGRVYIQTDTGVNLTKTGNAETMLIATPDGSVDLYHNNSKKLATTSSGVDITGQMLSDSLIVDGDGTFRSGAPNLSIQDTDTNRYANFSYGTRVLNIDNVMASGEVGTTVDPATAFRFTDTNGTTEVARFVPDDKSLLIGRTTSLFSSKLTVDADNATENPMAVVSQHAGSSSEYLILFYRGNDSDGYTNTGHIQNTNNATSYNTSSDYRLKENVDYTWDATTRLKQLKPARFNFISEADTTVDGFLAHEVSSIVPEAITGTKDATKTETYIVTPAVIDSDGNETRPAVKGTRTVPDYQGIDQSKIVPLLTKALIESVEKIEQLEARITALENV